MAPRTLAVGNAVGRDVELREEEGIDMIKKTKTAKEMVTLIRSFLTNADLNEALELWHILTALRGPDYNDGLYYDKAMLKKSTTEVIRHEVVGDFVCKRLGCLSSLDTKSRASFRHMNYSAVHFWQHAKLAFKSLGLKWGVKN